MQRAQRNCPIYHYQRGGRNHPLEPQNPGLHPVGSPAKPRLLSELITVLLGHISVFQSIKTYKGLTLEMALLSIPFVWLIALRKCAHSGTVGQRVVERDKTGRPKAAYKRVHLYIKGKDKAEMVDTLGK